MKRVTLFFGHYGSGKTNLAVNYALRLAKSGIRTAIGDIDTVNPYYRTKDSAELLKQAGVEVIALPYANTNVDLPSIPSEMYGLVQNRTRHAVLDIGGDDRGAYALGRFREAILAENDFEALCVLNFCRPLTADAESALGVLREIEAAARMPVTGLVNNTNLGAQTVPETVLRGQREAERLSRLTGLPLLFTGAEASIAKKLTGSIENILPLLLQKRPVD